MIIKIVFAYQIATLDIMEMLLRNHQVSALNVLLIAIVVIVVVANNVMLKIIYFKEYVI